MASTHAKTVLSVNVNKLATLRNSRGANNPDVLKKSLEIIGYGAQGITVHPRPDERHIRKSDVEALKSAIDVELNIEGYPSDDFLQMVTRVKPAQCTLVPDPPHVLTSNAGWLVSQSKELLQTTTKQLKAYGIRVSVFVEPRTISEAEYKILGQMGVDRVELYTERYAHAHGTLQMKTVLQEYRASADQALKAGLGLNAGHDLDQKNLRDLIMAIPEIEEVSIGHALICDALDDGLKQTIHNYRRCLE